LRSCGTPPAGRLPGPPGPAHALSMPAAALVLHCGRVRVKATCKDCGAGHSEHGRVKSQCKDCGTGHCCEYGRWSSSRCSNCGTAKWQCRWGAMQPVLEEEKYLERMRKWKRYI
jgi:hypothetical protein